MKKIITLLAVVGMFSLQGCTVSDGIPGPQGPQGEDGLIAEVFELKNVSFTYNANDGYTIYQKLTPNIYASDVILIYRLSGSINSNTPIWQLIPRTLFLPQGELDYGKAANEVYKQYYYQLGNTPPSLENIIQFLQKIDYDCQIIRRETK